MKKLDSKTKGYLFIAAAVGMMWLGSYFREPLLAHHKLLVAGAHENGGLFEKTVVLVVQHGPTGAFGFIVNKEGTGGPVDVEGVHTLHSTDVMPEGSELIPELGLGYIARALGEAEKKPAWHMTVKGYTGWKARQLDREIRRKVWKVIDYDANLVMATPMDKIYAEAEKRPESLTMTEKPSVKEEKDPRVLRQ